MGERTGTRKREVGRSARKSASETTRDRPTRGQDAEVADRGWSTRGINNSQETPYKLVRADDVTCLSAAYYVGRSNDRGVGRSECPAATSYIV
ncbi:hypothetical protein ALC62_00247 [Cyphomyrmex costatus]|uniref:Uncharacterized protein n=1 Tax=Cyphomyrmex costatus TaxID=456900 RepID=A0A195D7D8_9HYME|nr:hypothetical protein ALC62_00247 [Cyphomyrmex costatus]